MPRLFRLMPQRLLFFIVFCYITATAQENTKAKIAELFENYFVLDRENIYVHLDKTLFFTNETIWFKGYVFNKKTNLPFYNTKNVYAQLIDPTGAIISNQLLQSTTGVFSGRFNLNKEVKSGHYYLQFYTNWMNNFEEDESYTTRIKIINQEDISIPLVDSIIPNKLNITFYPEGGNFISDVNNIVGIKVTDINGAPIPNCSVDILDELKQPLKTINTNSFGMTKFNIIPNNQNYTAVLRYKDFTFEDNLPNSTKEGITLEANNYAFEDKLAIKLGYNKQYAKMVANKPFFLVIQKNEKSNIVEFSLNAETNSKDLLLSNDLLFLGVNSIRIIDSEWNEIAFRNVYKFEKSQSNLSLNVSFKDPEKLDLSGNSNLHDGCVSATILPTSTQINFEENIVSSLQINTYLNEKLNLNRTYFDDFTRSKKFELDLMMLNQTKNKYDWKSVKLYKIKENYPFEDGLQIKGIINRTSADTKKHRIQLKDLSSYVISSTESIENNEFVFNKTDVTDSILVYCDLINKADRTKKEMDYHLLITNKNKKYNKNYQPKPYTYPENFEKNTLNSDETPWFDKTSILLKEVEIKNEKTKLKRENQSGNAMLRGYKIGVTVPGNIDLLHFIEQNGFVVNRRIGEISIRVRMRNSINGQAFATPLVYIDERQLISFDELFGMRLDEFDEVYISSSAIITSMNNLQGIIRLYKKQVDYTKPNPSLGMKQLLGGYELITPFVNADYTSEFSKGFLNYGLIHWVPWILLDENGNFKISMPNKKHTKLNVIVEGFSIDGKIISIEKQIDLEKN